MSRHLNFHPLGLCKGTQQQFKAWEIYTWISIGFLNVELNATSVQTNEKRKKIEVHILCLHKILHLYTYIQAATCC